MSDLISRSALTEAIEQRMKSHEKDAEDKEWQFHCNSQELFLRLADECQAIVELIEEQQTVKSIPLSEVFRLIAGHSNYHGDSILAALTCITEGKNVKPIKPVEPVRGEWVYWKEQCEYCINRNTCPYPENQESMEALKQWEKENKFWGSLKLICDYYVLDKDKYYLDNPRECNAEG